MLRTNLSSLRYYIKNTFRSKLAKFDISLPIDVIFTSNRYVIFIYFAFILL